MITKDVYINKAKSYLGVVAGTPRHTEIIKAYNSIRPLPRGYTLKTSDAWCAGFVSAIAQLVGYGSGFPFECSVEKMTAKAKSAKMYVTEKKPNLGWLVVYDWQGDGRLDHVGIVLEVGTKSIKVIEGNYNNAVRVRTINYDSNLIKGYIALKYTADSTTSNLNVAYEVIRGKWGNGETRKKKLKNAGYDPVEIQKLVNKLLKG